MVVTANPGLPLDELELDELELEELELLEEELELLLDELESVGSVFPPPHATNPLAMIPTITHCNLFIETHLVFCLVLWCGCTEDFRNCPERQSRTLVSWMNKSISVTGSTELFYQI